MCSRNLAYSDTPNYIVLLYFWQWRDLVDFLIWNCGMDTHTIAFI